MSFCQWVFYETPYEELALYKSPKRLPSLAYLDHYVDSCRMLGLVHRTTIMSILC